MNVPLTVILAVKNEAANLPKCLTALKPAARVVVVDSGSTDATVQLAKQHGAEVVQFRYTGGHPKKRQWALEHVPISTPWVLLLDADEVVPEALWVEIETAIAPSQGANASSSLNAPRSPDNSRSPSAYLITKGFHFLGRRFTFGGFSFKAVLLFKTGAARFEKILAEADSGFDMEVHERLIVDGPIGRLTTPLIHEDFKSLHAYLDRHNRYSTWEAQVRTRFLQTGQWGDETVKPRLFGNTQERRRWLKYLALRMPFEPTLWFLYHYFFKLGFLEGRPGWIASRIRAQYIFQVRAKMYELRLQRREAVEVAPQKHA